MSEMTKEQLHILLNDIEDTSSRRGVGAAHETAVKTLRVLIDMSLRCLRQEINATRLVAHVVETLDGERERRKSAERLITLCHHAPGLECDRCYDIATHRARWPQEG
jgi:hypothetical protein